MHDRRQTDKQTNKKSSRWVDRVLREWRECVYGGWELPSFSGRWGEWSEWVFLPQERPTERTNDETGGSAGGWLAVALWHFAAHCGTLTL